MHSVLLVVESPLTDKSVSQKAWSDFLSESKHDRDSLPSRSALGPNVWLIPLSSQLTIFSSMSSLASYLGLKQRVLFLEENLSWITTLPKKEIDS